MSARPGVVLHAGMHKTASSSIQQSLNGFSDRQLVYYADARGRSNHGRAIFSLIGSVGSDRPRARLLAAARQPARPDARTREHFEAAVHGLGGRRLLVSAEGLMLLTESELQRVAAFFRERVERVAVVAYVRPPAAFITSMMQQRIRGGSLRAFDPSAEYRSYRESFGKFDRVFGRDNVALWKFDPAAFASGCAVRDFCRRLDIELAPQRIVRLNESLSREALGLALIYRRFGRPFGSAEMQPPQTRALIERLARIGRTRFRFAPELLRPILEQHRADIEWMEERLGASLREDLDQALADDVRGEQDLLAPRPQAVEELRALLGADAPAVQGRTPEEVARLVHALRSAGDGAAGHRAPSAAVQSQVEQGDADMNVAELIEHFKRGNPDALAGIPDTAAQAFIAGVFRHIGETLSKATEGVVDYPGLGRFRVRQLEKQVDGKSVTRTQIAFLARAGEARGGDRVLSPEQRKARRAARAKRGA